MRNIEHSVDLCVIGGGMAGVCAAIAAARHGVRVVLMHDRPVLGGNSSSECRVPIGGADIGNTSKYLRETGILEELRLFNLYCNPHGSYSLWDLVLYEKVRTEPRITLLLNCSCLDAAMSDRSIVSVRGWQLTTQTYHTVKASIFADCSGDGILAPLTGAEFRIGREARSEYGESIAPEAADTKTMGMTCYFHAKRLAYPQPYDPPTWVRKFVSCDELPYGEKGHSLYHSGYWWIELGGEYDSIHDTELLRDELLKIALGVWDHLKNHCTHRKEVENWAIDWIQFLPGKRESRRYLGAHVLAQRDIESGGQFDDIVAYGGWHMDDHHPAGFEAMKIGAPATIFHPAPLSYGIPYRSLYSKNIQNLMFAGRVASCTHAAMSSTRIMGTCSVMGQALGTAAALGITKRLTPAEVLGHVGELQTALMRDDCYLPGLRQIFPELTTASRLEASSGDPAPLRDGIKRHVGDNSHCWTCVPGDYVAYHFPCCSQVKNAIFALDSAMDKNIQTGPVPRDDVLTAVPAVMPRCFRIDGLRGGSWDELLRVVNNCYRHVVVPVNQSLEGIRFVLESTWGSVDATRVYAFYVE